MTATGMERPLGTYDADVENSVDLGNSALQSSVQTPAVPPQVGYAADPMMMTLLKTNLILTGGALLLGVGVQIADYCMRRKQMKEQTNMLALYGQQVTNPIAGAGIPQNTKVSVSDYDAAIKRLEGLRAKAEAEAEKE